MLDQQKIGSEVYALASIDQSDPLSLLVKEALDVIECCLDIHGESNVSLSFNGGKDCTVLLHLYAGALARRQSRQSPPIHAIYIPVPSPFPQLESFIDQASNDYHLDLFRCRADLTMRSRESDQLPSRKKPKADEPTTGGGEYMRQALQVYKDHFPNISAILVGTRRTDPHGANLTHRTMTDPGWPSFERVHPIINWDYSHIWTFLRRLGVGYCELYDEGYTSLGSTYNTFPNPALISPSSQSTANVILKSETDPTPDVHSSLVQDDSESVGCGSENERASGKHRYRPAYELLDGKLERCGRGPIPNQVVI